MSIEILNGMDFSAWDQPEPAAVSRQFLEDWLRYQRHEFQRKLRDLTPEGLVAWSVPPLELSVLGIGSAHDPDGALLSGPGTWWG